MTANPRISRRVLLHDMGKAGLAVMVLGVVACTTDAGGDETTTEGTGSDTGPTTTPAGATTSSSLSSGNVPHQWHRVDLGFVSAYLIHRAGEVAVVDTGIEGSEGAIEDGLGALGLDWGAVGNVVVTHRHPDHQGSLESVLSESGAPWHAGAGDLDAIVAATAGKAVGDGDRVFDLEVIETPGHTPGHIAVLDPVSGVLVAGDALNGADGGVAGANPRFSTDMGLANASVRKLAGFDYEVALFGHGEPVLTGASEMVARLAESLDSP